MRDKSGIGRWFVNLTAQFKMYTVVALRLLVNKKYTLADNWVCWEPTQYVWIVMYHVTGCNILNILNQLFFIYQRHMLELFVFIISFSKSTKASDFITTLEEKKDCWVDMLLRLSLWYNFQLQSRPQVTLSRLEIGYWGVNLVQLEKFPRYQGIYSIA